MDQRSLLVLATGGTIVGKAGSATRRDYRPGQIDIASFLESVAELDLGTRLRGRQVANIGSEDIGWDIWCRLHEGCMQAIADPEVDGVIVTHGTDTAEETAFLLDLTLPSTKPVVLVGAMRPADAVGSDGLRNFANAVQVARDPRAAGRGLLLVMGDHVLSARDARKARTSGTDAFRGFPRGPVALATPWSLEWLASPWREAEDARFAWPSALPEVPILHAYAGMAARSVERLVEDGARGVVLAGFGDGNMPEGVRSALADAAKQGVMVVRSSRTDEGLVDREEDDGRNGFVAARALGPAKARILAQLLIASGKADLAEAQEYFDRR
jgi:L-asparaginase